MSMNYRSSKVKNKNVAFNKDESFKNGEGNSSCFELISDSVDNYKFLNEINNSIQNYEFSGGNANIKFQNLFQGFIPQPDIQADRLIVSYLKCIDLLQNMKYVGGDNYDRKLDEFITDLKSRVKGDQPKDNRNSGDNYYRKLDEFNTDLKSRVKFDQSKDIRVKFDQSKDNTPTDNTPRCC